MTTVFSKESSDFYSAFFIPDSRKRKAALDDWINSATPAIQGAVKEELRSFIEFITANRWTEEGWVQGAKKLRELQSNGYCIVMELKIVGK